jgi:hypothetical protein
VKGDRYSFLHRKLMSLRIQEDVSQDGDFEIWRSNSQLRPCLFATLSFNDVIEIDYS